MKREPRWKKNVLTWNITNSWLKFMALAEVLAPAWRRCHFSCLPVCPCTDSYECCIPPMSAGTLPPHLHWCLQFFFFLNVCPRHSSSHCCYFLPFPPWPLPPCSALFCGDCFPSPHCVQQREGRCVGKPDKRRGVTLDGLLQVLAEAIRCCKLPLPPSWEPWIK